MSSTADLIAGLTPTGRRIAGPSFDLVEGTADNGLKHLVMVFGPQYADHPSLSADLQRVVGFMEKPDVPGVARLAAWEPEVGSLAYPTGTVWPVSEVVRTFADLGAGAGVKAGLELCFLVAEMLTEAHQAATAQGLKSHGSLSPWTVVLKGDGQPRVIGYGLPQVDLLAANEGSTDPTEDAYRYAPPERIEGNEEDLSSDLFALALLSLELMMGRPVYDGLVDDIRQQATRGEGMRRLYQWRERIPNNVREVLGRALKPDPDTRYRSGADFVYELHDLMGSLDVEGPSLVEVMAKVRAMEKRGRAAQPGDSGALSTAELREIAADLDVFDDEALRKPRIQRDEEAQEDEERPRWAPSSRGTDSDDKGAATARERLKRRLRSGGDDEPDEEADAPTRRSGSARERLKRRLKRSSSSSGSSADGDDDRAAARERLRRRLRRSSGGRRRPPKADDGDLSTGELPELELDPDSEKLDPDEVAAADAASPETDPLVPGPEPTIEPDAAPTEAVGESPASALRKSAAAELLAKLRTSGGGRRRRRSGDTPAPAEARSSSDGTAEPETPPEPALPEPAAAGLELTLADPALTLSVAPDTPAATVVRMATVDRGEVPVDLGGRVTGWWRLADGGEVVLGDTPASDLSGPLALVWVPNATRVLTIEVRGDGDPVRFQSPAGVAVPVGWLLRHLREWLDLSEGPWRVRVGEVVLAPDRILSEVLQPGDPVVVERG